MCKCKSMTYLLWCQCSFSEWNSQKGHLQPSWEREKAIAPCMAPMAGCPSSGPFALCPEIRIVPSQHSAYFGGRYIQTWTLQFNLSWDEVKAHAHFWVPCFCPTTWAIFWCHNSSLVPTRTTGSQLGTKPFPRSQHVPDTKPSHGMCLSKVSLQIWQFLWDGKAWRARRQYSFHLATASRPCHSHIKTIYGVPRWFLEPVLSCFAAWCSPHFNK